MEETPGQTHVTGTLEELVEALEERATGWHFMASDRKRDRALTAVQALKDGAPSVTVGNTVYTLSREVPPARTMRDESADSTVS
ncbi:hypothetical protein [Streptomyces narbonensis]|uniref:hypothetical protein n=1 Tax=Streptomyces narbonensis TaxID=67333 RepID=UPI0033CAFB10